ncbi:hypothetical protein [Endozoicomonas sp. ONNA2]|uniref:hypothetical protein n=1 Tax=Endozoicomonas sp. ONNA2 TaxID=2828741 RepID=UPI0021487921|nr:hypothetical protein [Endozoicomonas sp. ONNA2]
MQPISSQLPSFPPQTIACDTVCRSRYKGITANGTSISTVPASPLIYPGNRATGSTLSDYRVCQFAKGAVQVGNSLMRSVAGFAFQQVMDSPEVGLVCPGLKESLVVLLALPTLVSGYACSDKYPRSCGQHVPQCIPEEAMCDGRRDCKNGYDESAYSCPPRSKCENESDFLCENRRICVRSDWLCDGIDHCGDGSDEASHPSNENITGCTSSVSKYSQGGIYFGAVVGIGCASIIAVSLMNAVYKSVKAFRATNPEASTCQLIQMALRHPCYFRHHHPPEQIELSDFQQAMALPDYLQATALPDYQQATTLPDYYQATREPPTYAEAIAGETWV